ncbi:MAG: CHAD domain-containing protein [Planctomycetes bacterium]|nr:CHAD domain-containing protein [Planctomycetota bacterium]
MAAGKWISEITSGTATLDAARRVLGLRFSVLRDAVGGIFHERDKSLEDVHQLRVASRRAAAALDIFRECLKKKAYRLAAKRLKRLRRAAGEARDLDVLLMHYTRRLERAAPDEAHALDLLCGYALAERIPAQRVLHEACAGYPFEFERWMSETVSALAEPTRDIQLVGALGQRHLAGLCEQISQALSSAGPVYQDLHAVRIVGKRLRYAMEVFADCFPESFREELYPQVAELQEILGVVTDAHVSLQRTAELVRGLTQVLPGCAPRWSEALAQFTADLQREQNQGLERFAAWKARVQRTEFVRQFQVLLETPSGSSPHTVEPVSVSDPVTPDDQSLPVAHAS